ncbi:MAG TPA: methionine synthase [Candidatus Binatia bacterium]|nr:methionine synthase [Candidatus Binatia bacterium]
MLQTMIVGSLPRPTWLAPPHQMYVTPKLEGEVLREAHDDAVLLALADQQEAGLDILTDGEQRRRHYIWGFCEGIVGIDFSRLVKIATRGGRYGNVLVDAARVTGPVRRPRPILLDALRFLKRHTTKPVKVTLPGPMTATDTLADEHYRSRRALAADLAKALNEEAVELAENGCDIVQFDEPCFNIYLDEVEEWGVRTLEEAAKGVRAKTAVHICYGYGTPVVLQWKTKNTDWSHYWRTLPLLRTSTIDQISVECAASGVDPAVLGLAKGKDLMVGVIDVGTEEVETPEAVAARIRTALQYVSPEHLYPCTDCGMVPRSRAAARGKMKALADGAWIVRTEILQQHRRSTVMGFRPAGQEKAQP